MGRQVAAALCSAILGFMVSSSLGIAVGAGASASNAGRDRPVHTTIRDLMQSIIDPSADVLWGASGAVVDKEGVHELAPKAPEEWVEPRRAAIRIIDQLASTVTLERGEEARLTKRQLPASLAP